MYLISFCVLFQQYFYEFAFEELRSRPRHVLPYAVVSFQYKGKESATATHRYDGTTGDVCRKCITVCYGLFLTICFLF